ncbi:MAG: aminotransferase class V-fold PLP-dependent enzyme [Clostridia bacterium]|nr:aminotransferase class V-fold PLP-dependent enzyme [Clostridia bacterium]
MIYLDNSATTYPKPLAVQKSLQTSPMLFGANPGRGGYKMSTDTANEIYKVRSLIAEMFNAETEENVVFTSNCTHSLNLAIKGLAKTGGHAVTSCLEHNSVMRPLNKLCENGNFSYDVANVFSDENKTVASFESKIRSNTDFIVCTYASNVFGDILPVRKIGELAAKYNIPLIVDAAQAAGIIDIDIKRDNISCLCMPGHKGLYGPAGTGVLLLSDDCLPDTIIEGGTGSESTDFSQPIFLPDRFESGTQNTLGIIALGKGIEFVRRKKLSYIREHENELINIFYRYCIDADFIYVYNRFNSENFVPVLSFNLIGIPSEKTADILAENNIAVRGGFHCNISAHQYYKTELTGTVRVSVSAFNTKKDILYLTNCLNKIAKFKKV